MQFLVETSIVSDASQEVIDNGLEAELRQVRRLYGANVLRQIWHREDRLGSVILVEAASVAEVVAHMDTLPLAQAGVVKVDVIIPLKPHAAMLVGTD
ncbi:muconolactone Delta-isomerase family protein [Salinicola peritrichatus]|uniref:muconolactone Delta-isomerase family protein n=1 Tax=Salinicola peritrichatus TaxID=1267424 RepID=UPI000DA15F07|nr:muconolactone Delta-isomerase family protein [Salinicola peritrichatus]